MGEGPARQPLPKALQTPREAALQVFSFIKVDNAAAKFLRGGCACHLFGSPLPFFFWGLNPHTWWQISVAYNWSASPDEWGPTGRRGKVWQSEAVSLTANDPASEALADECQHVSRSWVSRRAERFRPLAGWQKAQVHLGAQPAPVMVLVAWAEAIT